MSLELPFGVKVLDSQPLDTYKYNTSGNLYTNTAEVLSQVAVSVRYIGQEFLVDNGSGGADLYLFKNDTSTLVMESLSVLDEEGLVSESTELAASQRATKSYVDSVRSKANTDITAVDQTLDLESNSYEIVEIELQIDWSDPTFSNMVIGKKFLLKIGTDEGSLYPWQITFPSNWILNDGVAPVLKNNTNTKFDYIEILPLTASIAQVLNVYYSE